jgi:hypothetical protein
MVVTDATSPAFCKAASAWLSGIPSTAGTTTVRGWLALHTVMTTAEPGWTDVLPGGLCPTTRPAELAAQLLVVAWLTARPSSCKVVVAWLWVWPLTSGTTAKLSGPEPDPGPDLWTGPGFTVTASWLKSVTHRVSRARVAPAGATVAR